MSVSYKSSDRTDITLFGFRGNRWIRVEVPVRSGKSTYYHKVHDTSTLDDVNVEVTWDPYGDRIDDIFLCHEGKIRLTPNTCNLRFETSDYHELAGKIIEMADVLDVDTDRLNRCEDPTDTILDLAEDVSESIGHLQDTLTKQDGDSVFQLVRDLASTKKKLEHEKYLRVNEQKINKRQTADIQELESKNKILQTTLNTLQAEVAKMKAEREEFKTNLMAGLKAYVNGLENS